MVPVENIQMQKSTHTAVKTLQETTSRTVHGLIKKNQNFGQEIYNYTPVGLKLFTALSLGLHTLLTVAQPLLEAFQEDF